jgi:hypothetical protein
MNNLKESKMDQIQIIDETVEVKDALDSKLERFAARFSSYKEKEDADFSVDKELKKLLPKNGVILDYVFGPNERKEGESFKQYKFRQKVDNYILRTRLQAGIKILASGGKHHGAKSYVNPEKQQAKIHANMMKIFRLGSMLAYKTKNGVRMPDNLVKILFSPGTQQAA